MSNNVDFIAIGVKQGDAFFFEKADKKLLLDGGNSRIYLPLQFLTVTQKTKVDVLVCTHSDSDHARGVLGFLQDKRLSAEEAWLPASWMDRLKDLLQRPKDFLKELIRNIEKLNYPLVSSLSNFADYYATKDTPEGSIDEKVEGEDILRSTEEADAESPFYDLFFDFFLLDSLGVNKSSLLHEAILTSNLIRQIVLAAYRSGARVRWFDYIGKNAQNASGGIPGFLVPVNAIEVVRIERPRKSALEHIALTLSNKQSLVFSSPPDKLNSGVLFTADSNLSFNQVVPWHDQMIITSPHHGSESNREAYLRFKRETAGRMNVVWVRSDKKFSSRPGTSYLLTKGRRYCTVCRNYTAPKQNVRMSFSQSNNVWKAVRTRKCQCK